MDRERPLSHYDFCNLLFAGPCNQRCPMCIGRQLDPRLNHDNLDEYPPRGLHRLSRLVAQHDVRQIVFTGTTTDPQLYRHEARLIGWFRRTLPRAQISLHTNGQLALQRQQILNAYDRATISFPSFDPDVFQRMTGVQRVPDLEAIARVARIPIKISCLVTCDNASRMPEFLARCRSMGIRRIVLRRPYGYDPSVDPVEVLRAIPEVARRKSYRGNPVYAYHEVEVTCWDFTRSTCTALNLFSDGTISRDYSLLPRHVQPNSQRAARARSAKRGPSRADTSAKCVPGCKRRLSTAPS